MKRMTLLFPPGLEPLLECGVTFKPTLQRLCVDAEMRSDADFAKAGRGQRLYLFSGSSGRIDAMCRHDLEKAAGERKQTHQPFPHGITENFRG